MWQYRRVNTLLDRNWKLFFQGVPLLISPQGLVLSEVNKDLEEKMKKTPHLFIKLGEAQKVEKPKEKEEIVVKRRRGRKPKSVKEEE